MKKAKNSLVVEFPSMIVDGIKGKDKEGEGKIKKPDRVLPYQVFITTKESFTYFKIVSTSALSTSMMY